MAGVQGAAVAPAGATQPFQPFQPAQANAAGQFDYTAMLNTPQGGKGVGGDTRYIPRDFARSRVVAPPVASTQPYTGDSGGPSDYAAPLAGGGGAPVEDRVAERQAAQDSYGGYNGVDYEAHNPDFNDPEGTGTFNNPSEGGDYEAHNPEFNDPEGTGTFNNPSEGGDGQGGK